MARLIASSPCAGLLPRQAGGVELTEVALGPVTSIAPFKGQADAAAALLGMPFPGPCAVVQAGDARMIWVGPGRALLCGVLPPAGLDRLAALTDQTDASAVVRVAGEGVETVLSRLVPVDLRLKSLPQGRTARTLLGHMTVSVTRVGDQTFEIMAMRSMAGTLVHELVEAAIGVAAR